MEAAQTSYNKIDIGIYRKCEESYFGNSKISSAKFGENFPRTEIFELGSSINNIIDYDKSYWVDKFSKFTIQDKTYKINRELLSIKDAIIESQSILQLVNDWDEDGAIATNSKTYFRTINFLLDYSNFIYNQYNHIIEAPEINIVRDGSIDLEWRNNESILLINFKKVNSLDIHFYSEDFLNSTIFKGILTKKELNIDLAHWMKKI